MVRKLLGLGLIAAAAGVAWLLLHPSAATTASSLVKVPSRMAAPSPSGTSSVPAEPSTLPAATVQPGIPRKLRITSSTAGLRIQVQVKPIRIQGGTLNPPRDPNQVGWWRDGARPGASVGTAVFTGHTVHVDGVSDVGGGALGRVGLLREGDRLQVDTDHGKLRYVVRSVSHLSYRKFALQSARIQDQSINPGRLVLITCRYNGRRFVGNILVYATLAS